MALRWLAEEAVNATSAPTTTATTSAAIGNQTSGGSPQENVAPLDTATEGKKESFRTAMLVFAGVSTFLAVLMSAALIRKHLLNWTRPREQRKIVGILWLAPIFAIDSFISLVVPPLSPTMDLLKDIYEGYTVYLFFSLMVEFLGGEARCVELIKQRLEPFYRPWPMNKCCTSPLTTDAEAFVMSCKRGVMQFVVVRPLMAMIGAILWLAGVYTKGDLSLTKGYFYIEFINNVSVTWALYCLVIFYGALKRPLQPHNPVPKFLAIKLVVFLSFWQGVTLAILARFNVIQEVGSWTAEHVTTGIHDLLICFEMLFAALYHRMAFPWQDYDRGRTGSIGSVGLDDNFALSDARRDFAEMMPHKLLFTSSPRPSAVVHATVEGEKAAEQERMAEITGPKKDVLVEGEQPLLRDDGD